MEMYKEEIYVAKQEQQHQLEETAKTCISCLWSFLVSMTGGLILGYWESEYHPTYNQLWMVPLGLILLITPVIAWLAVFVSELRMCWEEDASKAAQSVRSIDDSVHDPEK
ncbi:Group XV phospholipase [Melia azedarach]|uniref:Group XV phospholipase n=1 Tax=Melia azedarach TaxID=155640 RepID=A0ACC1YXV5_MELAZ|nr:Group XV phospholipase [Melia azedarach]